MLVLAFRWKAATFVTSLEAGNVQGVRAVPSIRLPGDQQVPDLGKLHQPLPYTTQGVGSLIRDHRRGAAPQSEALFLVWYLRRAAAVTFQRFLPYSSSSWRRRCKGSISHSAGSFFPRGTRRRRPIQTAYRRSGPTIASKRFAYQSPPAVVRSSLQNRKEAPLLVIGLTTFRHRGVLTVRSGRNGECRRRPGA
jgi:hypothetical protein